VIVWQAQAENLMNKSNAPGKRTKSRVLVVQALYQVQLTDHSKAELISQFHDRPEYERVDQEYFDEALAAIIDRREALQMSIAEYADRPVAHLDPVELALLQLGFYELESRSDVPYRAVINEAVNLAKRFGALDGHKYINAVLDRAAKSLRPEETS
jgi:N utilization substance protein B